LLIFGGLKSQDVKKFEKNWRKFLEIFAFLEKRPLAVKFSKLYFESFHCDTDRCVVFKFHKHQFLYIHIVVFRSLLISD